MKIFVKTKPGAREAKVDKIDDSHYEVSVKAAPDKGEANEAAIKLLSKYFSVPQANIRISHGRTNKQKIIEIDL